MKKENNLFKEMCHYKNKCIDLMCKIDKLKVKQLSKEKKVLEMIEEITCWTCKCRCVTFDNKKCRICGNNPEYGEIDYERLIKEIKKVWEEK